MNLKLKTKEAETQKAIREYLEWRGWQVRKLTIPRYSKGKGLPDLLAWKNKRMIFWEIKSPTTYYKETPEQQQFFADLEKVEKVRGTVVRSIEEVKQLLSEL